MEKDRERRGAKNLLWNLHEGKKGKGSLPPSGSMNRAAIHVPGALAPTVNVLALWTSLARDLLRSKTSFAYFLHSFLRNSPTEKVGTGSGIWPITAPHPKWFTSRSRQSSTFRSSTRSMQMAVNLAVLCLSWLHMGSPKRCPEVLYLGSPLTGAQRLHVRRLEEAYKEISKCGDVGPAEMGRSAARAENLETPLNSLHAQAEFFLPQSYGGASKIRAPPGPDFLMQEPRPRDDAEVVGTIARSMTVVAKAVDSSRLSFPEDAPSFDPTQLLEEPHKGVYVDPIGYARPPTSTDRPPRSGFLEVGNKP